MGGIREAYRPRVRPFAHQRAARKKSALREYFAYLMEQGTGKTKVVIDDSGELYERGEIDVMIVLAPNDGDVPSNWIDQIEVHLPERIPRLCYRLEAEAHTNRIKQRLIDEILQPVALTGDERKLRVITSNIEMARRGSKYFKKLLALMRKVRCILIVDESTEIKNPGAEQCKGADKLAANACYRRIMTGTLTETPFDAFSQMRFLSRDIFGDSFTVFKAEYCQMLPANNGLVKFAAGRMAVKIKDPERAKLFANRMAAVIQIPAKGPGGQPIYRNLDKMHDIIAEHSYRCLKADCTDLPPKLYAPFLYVDLTPKQREIYDRVRKEVIAEFVHDGRLETMTLQLQIVRLLRLQQIVGNHFMRDPDPDLLRRDRKVTPIEPGTHPRMDALSGVVKRASKGAKGIIWCRFRAEIDDIEATLVAAHGREKVVTMHGGLDNDDRVLSRKRFQDPGDEAQWIICQSSASKGYELTLASWEFFYSNSYTLLDRLQAEDRADRIGRIVGSQLTIFDVIARNTLDEKIVHALREKKTIAALIAGDPVRNWI